MPDLGKYADTVLSAYAVTLVLLALLVLASVLRARQVKRQLERVEARNG
ncbi:MULTISPECIES: heme exporter protein CcmD [unclassified Roseivivax]